MTEGSERTEAPEGTDAVRTFESFFDYHMNNAGEPCPWCGAEWVTEYWPNGGKYQQMRHTEACQYMAWVHQDDEADIA